MKIGDKVAIFNSGEIIEIATIDGENKQNWLIGDYWRFGKSNLFMQITGTGICYRIEPATQTHIDTFRRKQLLNELYHNIKWSKLDLKTLEKVYAITTKGEK
jgi:hypothetical protein